jgi:lipopolysaccharide assembly outer membrane protein LptD (OstA)
MLLKPKHILKTVLLFSAVFFMSESFAQTKQTKQIKILNGSLSYDQSKSEAQTLTDNVVFEHEGAIMNCDIAYLYSKENRIEAFGNVRIKQGDSLTITGDSLYYDGNSKMAKLRGNVFMSNRDLTLKTRFLDYNMQSKSAYFYNGGNMNSIKRKNKLYSQRGTFNTATNMMFFKGNVKLENEQYTMTSDTLLYNTTTEITYFHGPSHIVSDSNTIYCENGWYDTNSEKASFSKNAVINYGQQILTGDSVYYDRNSGIGKAYRNISITDTSSNANVKGQYGFFNEKTNYSFITGKPLLIQPEKKDTLYLRADTLEFYNDSLRTGYYGYHNVKFYRNDLQGMADSLAYSEIDSMMHFYGKPVLWSGVNQMNADSLQIKTFKGEVYALYLNQNAFLAEQNDSLRFNQIKGKTMQGYFEENDLKQLFVKGNGEAIYFMKEDSVITGMNKIVCSNILIELDSNTLKNIVFYEQPTGAVTPINDVKASELLLPDFTSYFALRPKSVEELLEGR